jgi:(p)ppGpp synthase/HD superfamily hydrolase
MSTLNSYEKTRIALRWRLIGAGFHKPLKALDFLEKLTKEAGEKDPKVKFRKDGVTPTQSHQIGIASYTFTLKGVEDILEDLLTVILLHDVMEDFNVTQSLIASEFGTEVADAVWCVTKKYNGVVKSPEHVFSSIAHNVLAALAKGCDRINDFQSMHGAFTPAKQVKYLAKGSEFFRPMLKEARQYFTKYTDAFLNIEIVLGYQMQLLHTINKGH